MKVLIFAMGPGETSQAAAVAHEIQQRGGEVLFAVRQDVNLSFIAGENKYKTFLTPTPADIKELAVKEAPDRVLLCNSKSFGNDGTFINDASYLPIPTFTVDSNWLFDSSQPSFPFIRWAKNYYINLPQQVFELGLKENGGYFTVSPEVRQKIKVVGLIPSYPKLDRDTVQATRKSLGIGADEKLVFCYFSGFGADSRDWLLKNAIDAIETVRAENEGQVKLIYHGILNADTDVAKHEWVRPLTDKGQTVSPEEFYKILSSADLMFQHQGLGTLAQAISAEIPTIANVRLYPDAKHGYPAIHVGEVEPFAKVGACRMVRNDTEVRDISKEITELLYNAQAISDMQRAQREIYSCGEKVLVDDLLGSD